METGPTVAAPKHHKRNKSAVLKSIMPSSKIHKRGLSEDTRPMPSPMSPGVGMKMSFLPPDHPHGTQRVLGEIPSDNNTAQPRRSEAKDSQPQKPLHKRTKSSLSMRSLGKAKDESKEEKSKSRPTSGRKDSSDTTASPNKKKSTTSLAAMFKSRSAKDEENDHSISDKENSSPLEKQRPGLQTPIYAAFSSQSHEVLSTTKVPLNDREKRHSIIQEIALYEPRQYDGSKQRNFHGYDPNRPNLVRPKSEVIASHDLANRFLDTSLMRKLSNGRSQKSRVAGGGKDVLSKVVQDQAKDAPGQPPISQHGAEDIKVQKRSPRLDDNAGVSRVKDAVARINRRTKQTRHETTADPKKFAADFEAMLDARNIPEVTRQTMRTLEQHVKEALLHSYEQDQETARGHSSGSDGVTAIDLADSSRPSTRGNAIEDADPRQSTSSGKSEKADSKKTRPRARTFTFKKSATTSPSKKQKTEDTLEIKRISQPDLTSAMFATSPGTPTGSGFFGLAKKANVAEDYVKYLQKHQVLAELEIGKLHKLRQLLRNENVSWVHKFIDVGGMSELVDLLHRLMDIEWREERDDQILSEALLCLKALCTTDLALSKLCEIEHTLFPALLAMLFDKEHKGPSEFTTRQVIMNLLLTHLEAAVRTPDVLPTRAKTILSYLADQTHTDKRNPLPFDMEIGPKRPYKVWNREVSNVTKEVFWVWLHPLNVIPYPHIDVQEPSSPHQHPSIRTCPPPRTLASEPYTREFFPRPRPPVPAAPYIGGVEWDATNYLATHIDLLNGLIAALPTPQERNALRSELRASGFERTMGEKLRQCKEKYYGAVHDVLRTWVGAAVCDGWDVREVRNGPSKEDVGVPGSPRKSSPRKKVERPPVLEAPPKLDLELGFGGSSAGVVGGKGLDGWI